MRESRSHIAELLVHEGGLLSRRQHPELVEQFAYQVRLGRLRPLLPGVYVDASRVDDVDLRIKAVGCWNPDAVLVEQAAARSTFWPQVKVDKIDVAADGRTTKASGYRLSRRTIPPELITEVQGNRVTSPALTALDLSLTLGANAIDTVLRTRAATLDQLHEALALTPSRRSNPDRRTLLLDSRDKPWSEAERDLHRLLREAGIVDWEGNWGFELLSGWYWIDVAFPELKLAIEVDGWEFHSSREAFESDRWRQNDLVLAGWRVLRFTAKMIRDQPQIVVRLIERALAA